MELQGRIFDGENIMENGKISVSVDTGKIEYAEQAADVPKRYRDDNITFLPGLIDTHIHLFGTPERSLEGWVLTSDVILTVNSLKDLKNLINSGFTTVRTMGDKVSLELSRAEKLGIIESPRIISSGYSIAETGGNDDPKMFPLDFAEKISYSYYADGPWECIKAVRKNIRAGAESIKAYASSSFVGGGSVRNELSIEELRSISGEAKKYGVPSAAHAYGASAIENVIESGFASVEHGLGLNEELAERMGSMGIFYTPTMSVYKAQRKNSSAYRDSYIKRHLEKEVTIADSVGVKIVAGTDFVGSTEERHGNNYLEAVYLSQVIGNLKALKASTSLAAECLGLTDRGHIKNDYAADIIGVYGNPMEDINCLRPEKVALVIKNGKILKNNTGRDFN